MDEEITLESGHRIVIWHDIYVESPREWISDSKFHTWHRSYASPDEHNIKDPMYAIPRDTIVLPVWMYDHSGCCYAAADSNPFHCPWDSGQVGWIFISRADARARLGVKRLTQKHIDKIRDQLISEVKIFSEYVNGEVYGFTVFDPEGEELDSCGGFYGSDRDYMLKEAKSCLKSAIS
jgi:hypothetical protein